MKSGEWLEYLKLYAAQRPKEPTPRCTTSQCTIDKLDQDFILYMSFAFESLEKMGKNHSKYQEIFMLWLSKLCAENYSTLSAKRTRNLYLSKLILSVQEGTFSTEFLAPPSCEIGHLPYREILYQNKPGDPTQPSSGCEPMNQSLNVSNYIHLSEDRRTYVATEPIQNGIMSYVAVTMGGVSPQWVNKNGDPISFPAFNLVRVVTPDPGDESHESLIMKQAERFLSEDQSIREQKKKILARRKPKEDRTKLMLFYDEILRRIDVEMDDLTGKACVESKNPLIEQLTKKLHNTVVSQTAANTVQDINTALGKRKVLLTMLRNNIESQKKNIFEKRELILNKIENAIKHEENELQNKTEFQFIQPSVPISNEDDYKSTIWAGILNQPMHPKHVCMLKRKYCYQIATVIQALLKEDKVKIINQAQSLAKDVEEQMIRDLQEEMQKGLTIYSNARQEWINIQNVLKEIDRARAEIVKEKMACQCINTGCNTKLNLLDTCAQINSMKLKLEWVNKRNEELKKFIKIVHSKIHQAKEQTILCQDESNCEYEHLKFCATEKQNEIREQELQIKKDND